MLGLRWCCAKLETDGAYTGTTHGEQRWCWGGRWAAGPAPGARPCLFVLWHGCFLDQQRRVCWLCHLDGVPVTHKAPFVGMDGAVCARVPLPSIAELWRTGACLTLKPARGAGPKPGKGSLMRRYNASLLSVVYSHN